jgi:hypothetical protein
MRKLILIPAAVAVGALVLTGCGPTKTVTAPAPPPATVFVTPPAVTVTPTPTYTPPPTSPSPTPPDAPAGTYSPTETQAGLTGAWAQEPASTQQSLCAVFKSAPDYVVNTFTSKGWDGPTVKSFFASKCATLA